MPYRTTPLVNDEYYHVFNRGVARMPIFTTKRDYQRFIQTFVYYFNGNLKHKFSAATSFDISESLSDKTVDLIAYCLMPNHFHFLLKQIKDNGISNFMRNISNSYTKYFNIKNNRVGPLLQGPFKVVHIESEEQLLHVSRYIHLNSVVGFIVKEITDYQWSSYLEYVGLSTSNYCQKNIILKSFSSKDAYIQFILDQEDYAKRLSLVKHLLIDFED